MFSTLRTRFGIPGVISVMALVFAMFGGAYAASNSSDGGKATASAKAKKGPRGPKGATGAAGPQGPAGPAGPAGAKGDAGAAGANGAGVTSKTVPTSSVTCNHLGGSEFTSASGATTACNGEPGEPGEEGVEGDPWSVDGTLPSKATETGTYYAGAEVGGVLFGKYAFAGVSIPIPLPQPINNPDHVIFVSGSGAAEEHCENTEHPGEASRKNPEADPGYLCLYEGNPTSMTFEEPVTPGQEPAVGVSGTLLTFSVSEPDFAAGSWAVTAP